MDDKVYVMIIIESKPITENIVFEINDLLENKRNVLITIMHDENMSYHSKEIESEIKKQFWKYLSDGRIKTQIIPKISMAILKHAQ